VFHVIVDQVRVSGIVTGIRESIRRQNKVDSVKSSEIGTWYPTISTRVIRSQDLNCRVSIGVGV
jgi:hypothetical protein